MARAAALVLLLTINAAAAEAPETSIRPVPRGGGVVAAEPADAGPIRPMPRPEAAPAPVAEAAPVTGGLGKSLRPVPRPRNFAALLAVPQQSVSPAPEAVAAAPPPEETQPRQGLFARLFGPPRARPAPEDDPPPANRGTYICGDRAIIGRVLEPIGSSTSGCGVAEPVQVTVVDGIRLSQAATMDCPTALALHRWIDEGLRPAFRGREPAQLVVAAHYICRTRNNRPGARISEHGRGKAIDIAAITFTDGTTVTVSNDFGRALRRAYRAACGIFGTTLGPGSDGYHEDHMHFDTANHRNGPYCR